MYRFITALAAAVLLIQAPGVSAAASPVAEVGKLIAECENTADDAKCAAKFWKFADITGDGTLTVAEITRFFRLVVEHQVNENAKNNASQAAQVDPFEAVAATFLIGPIAAGLVIDNFDYNGNRKIEREEVFADIDEGTFTAFVFQESRKLPERAGTLMFRAMQAGSAVRGP